MNDSSLVDYFKVNLTQSLNTSLFKLIHGDKMRDNKEWTLIHVKKITRERLRLLWTYGDTYDKIIGDMLDYVEGKK